MKPYLVYIAGPYRNADPLQVRQNILNAQKCATIVKQEGERRGENWCPVVPHTMTGGLDHIGDDQYFLDFTMEVMRRCDAVALCEGWSESAGAIAECKEAIALGKELYIVDLCGVVQDCLTERQMKYITDTIEALDSSNTANTKAGAQ